MTDEEILRHLHERLIHILYGDSVVRKVAKNDEDIKSAIAYEFAQALKQL